MRHHCDCTDSGHTNHVAGSSTSARSAPREGGSSQQLCLMPLRTDGSPAIGDPLCVGTHVQLRFRIISEDVLHHDAMDEFLKGFSVTEHGISWFR